MASQTDQSHPQQAPKVDSLGAFLLSGIAGYVDASGFLALFGLFTAHVTGNLVTAGAAVARRGSEGVVARLAMLPIFMIAVGATTLVARSLRERGREPLVSLLALMTVGLVVFCATGVSLASSVESADARAVIFIGGTGVLAMGIQNALMREALGSGAPTTVMTGNLTQFTMDLVAVFLPAAEPDQVKFFNRRAEARGRLKKFGVPLLGFVAGAAGGAWLTSVFSFWSIALPTLVAAALTARAMRATAPATPAVAAQKA